MDYTRWNMEVYFHTGCVEKCEARMPAAPAAGAQAYALPKGLPLDWPLTRGTVPALRQGRKIKASGNQ